MLGCCSSGLRPMPSAGAGLSVANGSTSGREQHQPDEEGGDAHHHRGRPGDDLAQPVAGRVERGAGGDREHPGPEQQRALLARPHRRQLVEGRRLDRGVLGDERRRRSRRGEGDLDDRHAGGQQRAEGVDGAARGVEPAAVAVASGEGERAGGESGEEGQRQQGAAEARHRFSVVNFDGHFVIRVSGSPTKVAVSTAPVRMISRPPRNGSGTVPRVGDREALAARRRGRRP